MNNAHLNILATHEEAQVTSLGSWPGIDFLGVALPYTGALRKRIWIRYNGVTCYAQVYDVGPWCCDDADYVLCDSRPRAEKYKGLYCPMRINSIQKAVVPDGNGGWIGVDICNGAGIDLFPATAKCLGITIGENVLVDWCFSD